MVSITIVIEGKTIRRDGYTSDGRYYGTPGKVFEYYSPDLPAVQGAVRARTIAAAKKLISDECLNQTFYFPAMREYLPVGHIVFER